MKDSQVTIKHKNSESLQQSHEFSLSETNPAGKNSSQPLSLYLQIISLTSENELLRNQIYQQQQEITRLKIYETTYSQSIKATQSIIYQQLQQTNLNNLRASLKRQAEHGENSDQKNPSYFKTMFPQYKHPTSQSLSFEDRPSNEQNRVINKSGNYLKLKQYRYLGQLNFSEERQTVKSMNQSRESLNAFHMNHDQLQLASMNKKMIRHSDMIKWQQSNGKPEIIHQMQDSSNVEQRQAQLKVLSSEGNAQNRKTAYFKMHDEPQSDQNIPLYQRQSFLHQVHESIEQAKLSITNASQIVSRNKCIPVGQYFELLQMKRDCKIKDKKVTLLEQQTLKLKSIILKMAKEEYVKKHRQ